jgi:hypothetical protein
LFGCGRAEARPLIVGRGREGGKGREGKGREGKGREGKGREGKVQEYRKIIATQNMLE